MTLWVAFLRGINLGRRQMKMAELKAVFGLSDEDLNLKLGPIKTLE